MTLNSRYEFCLSTKLNFLANPTQEKSTLEYFSVRDQSGLQKVIKITRPNDDYFDNISTHIVFRRFCPHSILLVPAYRNTQPKKQKFHK